MRVMETGLMQLIGNAMDAAKNGDRDRALALAEVYSSETATRFPFSEPEHIATLTGPLVQLYMALQDWELACLKSKDLCALAEKHCPNTSETAGDYTNLATALEHIGDLSGAMNAIENAVRHIKGANEWPKYSDYYQQRIVDLHKMTL